MPLGVADVPRARAADLKRHRHSRAAWQPRTPMTRLSAGGTRGARRRSLRDGEPDDGVRYRDSPIDHALAAGLPPADHWRSGVHVSDSWRPAQTPPPARRYGTHPGHEDQLRRDAYLLLVDKALICPGGRDCLRSASGCSWASSAGSFRILTGGKRSWLALRPVCQPGLFLLAWRP